MPLTMKRLGLVLTVAVTALGALAAAAVAMVASDSGPAGPSGVHITPLSKGTLASSVHAKAAGIEITTNGRKDILITKITVDPGRLVRLAQPSRPGARRRGQGHADRLRRDQARLPAQHRHGATRSSRTATTSTWPATRAPARSSSTRPSSRGPARPST